MGRGERERGGGGWGGVGDGGVWVGWGWGRCRWGSGGMSTALLANLGRVQDHKDVLGCDVVQRHHHKAEDPVQAEQGKQDDAGPRDFPGSKEARILAG